MRYLLTIGWILSLTITHLFAQGGYDQLRSDQTRVIDGKKFFVHEVKKGQTLYSISKAYDLPMEDIIETNPEIRQGLKANQTLLIPDRNELLPAELPPAELPPLTDSIVIDQNTGEMHVETNKQPMSIETGGFIMQHPCGLKPDAGKEVYNVALMMHLFLKEVDFINTKAPTQKEIESYNALRYIQFYEGFLIAVDSLRKTGLNLNLYVYSLETSPSATSALLKKPEMEKMNLIVGMLFNRDFEIVASWAKDHGIPVVSPISERESQVEGNPMVIKIRPSYISEGTALAEYLYEHHPYSHILLVRSWEEESKIMAEQIHAKCQALNLDVNAVSQDDLVDKLITGAENAVVVVSSQKTFVLNILSQLNADTLGHTYTVFGLPRWDEFEGMDYQYLEKARAHIFVPSWIDYSRPDVKRLVQLFRESYKTEPDNLAFQGFDVAWYFLNALKQYGEGFSDCLMEITIKPLQTEYKFRQHNGDGWENHHWEVFRYDNYYQTHLN